MSKTRISLLVFVFLSAMFYQPTWVYENFWSKADFYDSAPFVVPYLVILTIYSLLVASFVELTIRFIKKYA
jgi:hypothetical protein